jgi:hypothetical protein
MAAAKSRSEGKGNNLIDIAWHSIKIAPLLNAFRRRLRAEDLIFECVWFVIAGVESCKFFAPLW